MPAINCRAERDPCWTNSLNKQSQISKSTAVGIGSFLNSVETVKMHVLQVANQDGMVPSLYGSEISMR